MFDEKLEDVFFESSFGRYLVMLCRMLNLDCGEVIIENDLGAESQTMLIFLVPIILNTSA